MATVDSQPYTRYAVRPATVADVTAIRAVAAITWEATYAESITAANRQRIVYNSYNPTSLSQAIRRATAQNPCAWFMVAESFADGMPEVVGFVEAEVRPANEGIELTRIYILPQHQAAGIGTLLLDTLLCALREALARGQISLSPPRLSLVVEAHNTRALDFYRRRGFHHVRAFSHAINNQILALDEYARQI